MAFAVAPTRVEFGTLSNRESVACSALKITTDRLLTEAAKPDEQGILSSRLGCLVRGQFCRTCGEDMYNCRSHFGHLEMPPGVQWIHPGCSERLAQLLNCVCHACNRLLLLPWPDLETCMAKFKMNSLQEDGVRHRCEQFLSLIRSRSAFSHSKMMDQVVALSNSMHRICLSCQTPLFRYRCKEKGYIEYSEPLQRKKVDGKNVKVPIVWHWLSPAKVLAQLRAMHKVDLQLLGIDTDVTNLVQHVLLVPGPSICRTLREGSQIMADQIPAQQLRIWREAHRLFAKQQQQAQEAGGAPSTWTSEQLKTFQSMVNYFAVKQSRRARMQNNSQRWTRSAAVPQSIELRMDRKTGLVRGSLGSRVNEGVARGVLANSGTTRAGVVYLPQIVCEVLGRQHCMMPFNKSRLLHAVRHNATSIRRVRDGHTEVLRLDGEMISQPNELPSYGDRVQVPLAQGEIVLVSRPPHLDIMSVSALDVAPQPPFVKTIGVSANDLEGFRGDYDGDDVKIDTMDGQPARVEAEMLMHVRRKMLSHANGNNRIGLLQGGIFGVAQLSDEATWMTHTTVLDLLAFALSPDDPQPPVPPPADRRRMLWSGRQVLEALLPRPLLLYYEMPNGLGCIERSRIRSRTWDKSVVGNHHRSLIAYLCRYYEAHHAQRLVRLMQRVGCRWLQLQATSIGMLDVECCIDIPLTDIHKAATSREHWSDMINERWEKVGKPRAQGSVLQRMIQSGARGNADVLRSILFTVGLLPPSSSSSSTIVDLLHVRGYSPLCENLVLESLARGKSEISHFREAGKHREDLGTTAKKTPQAGYGQRKFETTAESAVIAHDFTVRNRAGEIIQMRYGGTGFSASQLIRVAPDDASLPFDGYELYRNFQVLRGGGGSSGEMVVVDPARLQSAFATLAAVCTEVTWTDDQKLQVVLQAAQTGLTDADDATSASAPGTRGEIYRHLSHVARVKLRGAVESRLLHEWLAAILCAVRRAYLAPGAAAGILASSAFMPDMTQMAIKTHKHGDGVGPTTVDDDEEVQLSGIKRAGTLLSATHDAPKRVFCTLLDDTHITPSDLVEYWQRVQLRDLGARVEVAMDVATDRWVLAQDIAWRMRHGPLPANLSAGFRIVIDRHSCDDTAQLLLREHMQTLCSIVNEAPAIAACANVGFSLVAIDNDDDYPEAYRRTRPFVAYLAFASDAAPTADEQQGLFRALVQTRAQLSKMLVAGKPWIRRVLVKGRTLELHCERKFSFLEILNTPGIDPYRTYCNDMYVMMDVGGVELMRHHWLRELFHVFSTQGGGKHYYRGPFVFAADFATRLGVPSPFTRLSLEGSATDRPLAEIGNERSKRKWDDACFFGLSDPLEDSVAAGMVGTRLRLGTTWTELRIDRAKLEQHGRVPYSLTSLDSLAGGGGPSASPPAAGAAAADEYYVPHSPLNTPPPLRDDGDDAYAGAASPDYAKWAERLAGDDDAPPDGDAAMSLGLMPLHQAGGSASPMHLFDKEHNPQEIDLPDMSASGFPYAMVDDDDDDDVVMMKE